MLPLTARIQISAPNRKKTNLWIPLFLLWPLFILILFPLLLPILLMLGLLRLFMSKKIPKIIPFVFAVFSCLSATRGLCVDIEEKETKVKIIIN